MRDSMTGLRPAAAPTRREAIAALGALGAACALPARLALAGGGTEAQADVAVLDGDSATLASDWYERTGLDKDDVIAISLAQSAPAAYDAASVWDASEAFDGGVMACRDAGGKVTIWPAADGARVVAPADASELFMGFANCVRMNLAGLVTPETYRMIEMFSCCSSLESLDLSGWDVSSVTDMGYMFCLCSSLTSLDLSGWDVSSVTDMGDMFYECTSLESLDLSGWDVSSVTYMGYMFARCTSLTSADTSSWPDELVDMLP